MRLVDHVDIVRRRAYASLVAENARERPLCREALYRADRDRPPPAAAGRGAESRRETAPKTYLGRARRRPLGAVL